MRICLLGLRQSHVHDEDELESVVEWEPIGGIDDRFDDGQEGVDDPVGKPLSVIGFPHGEDCLHRPVGWEREAGGVDEELAGDVEED